MGQVKSYISHKTVIEKSSKSQVKVRQESYIGQELVIQSPLKVKTLSLQSH